MDVKPWKRSQVLGTRLHLIETATALFGERGFAGTPLEEVVKRAGLTRGAVYHHFKDKRALFDAVVDQLLLEVVDQVEHETVKRAVARGAERDSDAIELFVEAFADGGRRRILSVDAPSVLGRERWSELMWSRLLDPLRRVVARGAERGRVDQSGVTGLTHLLFGAVQEAALLVGQESTRAGPVSKEEVDSALTWLLEHILGCD
jgi:AcrR family transcriptional regulator